MNPLRIPGRVRRPWRQVVRLAADLLLPPVCPGCGRPSRELCGLCDQGLVRRPPPACPRCGEAVLALGDTCGSEHAELRRLAHHVAPWRFVGTGGALVRRFKLDADAGAGRWLARAMVEAWRQQVGAAWPRARVVPVPLHRSRRRARGFDQADWLARRIAPRLGYAVLPGVLVRLRPTRPQGDPVVRSREGNVEGAFAVRDAAGVLGRDIVLVDDVFTSGATARECARVLRSAGAARVAVLTACRS